ncbi:hypothetical protein PFLUV_G00133540 [Perca fluviatilis]|uniref:Uncharacterized protein n=1 Tax=Perca fluviatilis TaxID=8168 RepID=A0A6A5ERG7_PERFL|nr:hypothetical protein PFLUV_G00133540 [Perca fluviatilis]
MKLHRWDYLLLAPARSLVAYSSAFDTVEMKTRSPVGNGYLLGASVHLLLSTPTLLTVLHVMSKMHGCRT